MALSLVFIGCSKKETIEKKPEKMNENDIVLKRILKAGFDKKSIVEYEDRYVVDGDMIFYKSDSVSDKATTEQIQYALLVAPEYRGDVKVYLDAGSFSSINLNTVLDNVITAYNGLSNTLRFTRVFSSFNADIIIVRDNSLPLGVCGQGVWPFPNGRAGNRVFISENTLITYGITSAGELQQLIAHEIGHCVGMWHTNSTPSSPGGGYIPTTPVSDPASVFNGSNCGTSWIGFSTGDISGLNYLYNVLVFNPPSSLSRNQVLKQGEYIKSPDGRFTLKLQVDGNLVLSMGTTPLWSTNTCCDGTINRLIMQADGNLVLYDSNNNSRWSSGTANRFDARVDLQNDGNLVMYGASTSYWSTNTCCH